MLDIFALAGIWLNMIQVTNSDPPFMGRSSTASLVLIAVEVLYRFVPCGQPWTWVLTTRYFSSHTLCYAV